MNTSRIDKLDFIRAIAIIPVVLGHYWLELVPGGALGVYFFFPLSGFLISMTLNESLKNNNPLFKNYFLFILKRFFRVYPTYFIFSVTSILVLLHKNVSLSEAEIINIFLLFKKPHWVGYSLGVIWTLIIEFWFYVIFGFIFYFFSYFKLSQLSFVIFPIISIFLSFSSLPIISRFSYYFIFLGMGCLTYKFSQKFFLKSLQLDLILLFAYILCVFNFTPHGDHMWPAITFLTATIGCLLILNRTQIKIKFFLFIGTISYSLYLWHAFIVDHIIRTKIFFKEYRSINLPLYLIMITAVSYFSYMFLETKGNKTGKILIKKMLGKI